MKYSLVAVLSVALLLCIFSVVASESSTYIARHYAEIPPAPRAQSMAAAMEKSVGCQSCHTTTDSMTMHESPGVILGCTDCHGGDSSIVSSEGDFKNKSLMEQAHVLPSYPDDWHYPHSANPKAIAFGFALCG